MAPSRTSWRTASSSLHNNMEAILERARRREARSQRRLMGYIRQMQPGAVEARLQEVRRVLAARSKREEEEGCDVSWRYTKDCCARDLEEDEDVRWPSSSAPDHCQEQQLLDLLHAGDSENVASSVDALSKHDFYEIKKIFFRYMQRVFRNCEVGDEFLWPMDSGSCFEALCMLAADTSLPNYEKQSEDARQLAFRYCSALHHCSVELAKDLDTEELRLMVAAALNAVLDDPNTLSRWICGWHSHHVVQACIRLSPHGAGEQLCKHFLEIMGEQQEPGEQQQQASENSVSRSTRMRAFAQQMVNSKPGEFVERVLISTIQHLPMEEATRLREVTAVLAVEQLRNCVELYEGFETALTLPRVILKHFISPGWKELMQVWAEDADAGQLLRSGHAVAVLLECLEEPSDSGCEEDIDLFRSLQLSILSRFERLLTTQPMADEWYSALGYTLVDADIWSRRPQRARLAKVLRQSIHELMGRELPPLRKTPLLNRVSRITILTHAVGSRQLLCLPLPKSSPARYWRRKVTTTTPDEVYQEQQTPGRKLLAFLLQSRPPSSKAAPVERLEQAERLRVAREVMRGTWQSAMMNWEEASYYDYMSILSNKMAGLCGELGNFMVSPPVQGETVSLISDDDDAANKQVSSRPSMIMQQAARESTATTTKLFSSWFKEECDGSAAGLSHNDFMDYMKGALFRDYFPTIEALRTHTTRTLS